ncbi:hypothetical protein SO694_00019347 [Aureococcus anophagefferens]|uniref:Uncharacterized protein n=1 Tax=Aureococcus anophagefferens TaxID=44056 RepID=A0ABR1G042_AURAN
MGRALLLCAAVLQSAAALLPAAPPRRAAAHARAARQRVQRTRAAPDEAALWDDEAGGALADVDLADLDDVDALYDARRCDAALVCAARAGLRPAELCVDAPSEAVAILLRAGGVRRFAADTVAAAAALAAALPRDARFLARGARRLPGTRAPSAPSATASSSRATGRALASRRASGADQARREAARDTVASALPLAALDAISKDERSAFDVWPLLALDDPAVEALVVDGGLDEEWETIKLPL